MGEIPLENLRVAKSINCDYCNAIIESKDCYLSSGYQSEDCLYTDETILNKECVDSVLLFKNELIYEGLYCNNSYNLSFCVYCDNCLESAFLYDCRNCQSCFTCVNLRNKKYHIFNKPYSKADYQKEIQKYNLGSYQSLLKIKRQFQKFNLKFPKAWAKIVKSINITGDDVQFSKNCHNCFSVKDGAEDCKYLLSSGLSLKDSYDVWGGGAKSELLNECVGSAGSRNLLCSDRMHNSYNISYSSNCFSSSNLFACVGLRHKQYCILNKQYTKEEYEELVPKIKKHMDALPYTDKKGRVYKYGEFFPVELSPFAYNETIAQEYFPLTKEQALKQGYSWYDKPKNEYKPTIKAKDLPDNIKDVDNSILKEVIECGNHSSEIKARTSERNLQKGFYSKGLALRNCAGSGVFRIIPQELKFYKKMNLPLPRLCPDCRHRERIKQRNPLKLWERKCMKKGCSNTFQTTYAPERKEIVYCEGCYNKEVG